MSSTRGQGDVDGPPLLEVEGLTKHFDVRVRRSGFRRGAQEVRAVQDVTFSLWPGETLGLVGESGCGKSTTARLITRLVEPTAGRIVFDGHDITTMSERAFRPLRRHVQMVFQDPLASLNPHLRVEEIVAEPLIVHGITSSRRELRARVVELLEQCGLSAEHGARHPGALSGGQQQRVGIARALALNPRLIICDEAVSALDLSVQAQILNLLQDLQDKFGLAYLFIAHDLGVVRHVADRVAVMYLGRLVELGDVEAVYDEPQHPYTRALISAIPSEDVGDDRIVLEGDVPSPVDPPPGCAFHPRCPRAHALADRDGLPADCVGDLPTLATPGGHGDRSVACWHPLSSPDHVSATNAAP